MIATSLKMTLETTLERSLKIKLGALKRLKKDYDFSIAESKEAEDLVQLKIVQNCDDATINHQVTFFERYYILIA